MTLPKKKTARSLVVYFDEAPRGHMTQALKNKVMMTFLECFGGRTRNILEYRFGFGINRSLLLKEVGELFGMTESQIFAEEDKAFEFIKEACRHYRLFPQKPQKRLKTGGKEKMSGTRAKELKAKQERIECQHDLIEDALDELGIHKKTGGVTIGITREQALEKIRQDIIFMRSQITDFPLLLKK